MSRTKYAVAVALALGAAGCAHPVPKAVEPSGDTQGAVIFGMTVRGREFPSIVPHRIETAYFAQVGLDGQLDRDNLLLSNYRAGDYVVLLNIPPGRYSPVAGSYFHKNVRYLVKIDPELSNSWIVEVRPGHVAFVGDALLRTDWEGALMAILNMLKNAGAFIDPFWHPTIEVVTSSPRLDKAIEDEALALHSTRRSLARTQWAGVIGSRLAELGNPPEPIRHGTLFKTTVKPTPAGRFAYIDTLGWGPPRKAPGGLEWVEPGKKAMVQVLFLQPGMAGYKPPDQYLDDMREAGSPDDSHNLYEVALASRTASAARYTIYQYPQASLTGSEVRVYVTETMMVQEADGIYIIRLRALRESFNKLHSLFRRFAGYVVFLPPEIPT